MSVLLEILGAGLVIALCMALRLLADERGSPRAGNCALGACGADCDRGGQAPGRQTRPTNY